MIAREIAVVGCIFSATIFGSIGLMEAARRASDSDAVGLSDGRKTRVLQVFEVEEETGAPGAIRTPDPQIRSLGGIQ